LNQEESALLLRDVAGYLIKPAGQYVAGYNNSILEDLGARVSDYSDPDNIMTILNQIAVIKQAKQRLGQERSEHALSEQAAKRIQAQHALEDEQAAKDLEEKLKEYYKQVQTTGMKKARKQFENWYDNEDEFTKNFYQAINDRTTNDVIGALWVLASKGKLLKILVDDKKISSLYSKHLTKKYGNEVAVDFSENYQGLAYLSYFLKHLLIDTLKMPETEAAALAIHLFNQEQKVTGRENEMIAYGDMASQEFMWREIKVENNKLRLSED